MDSPSVPQNPPRLHALAQPPIYHIPPPDDPPPAYDPPSYADATRSSAAPLLVGPSLNYGTNRAYPDLEAATEASSDIEETTRSLPEWVGQALVVIVFLSIIYGFWEFVHDIDPDDYPVLANKLPT